MNALASKALADASVGPDTVPPSGAQEAPSVGRSALQGLGLPAVAILLAAHPIGRRLLANAARIAPKEAAVLEQSRIPFFVNPVPAREVERGLGGFVRPIHNPSTMGLGELAAHPRGASVRPTDPFVSVALPEQLAETTEGTFKMGPARPNLKTVGLHEMQHAAGAAKSLKKETAGGQPATVGGFMRGALHDDLIKQPSTGAELVRPATQDFPDLPYMFALYRGNKHDPRFAVGELLNEYIARVNSGLPRQQNMVFGPWSGAPSIYERQLQRHQPELEDIMAGMQPFSDIMQGEIAKKPIANPSAWRILQEMIELNRRFPRQR